MGKEMPRRDPLREAMEAYLAEKTSRGLAQKTLEGYAYALERTWRILDRKGLVRAPEDWGTDQVAALLEALDPWTMKNVNLFLRARGSAVQLRPRTVGHRPGRWLTPVQANVILTTATKPPYEMAVHCELELGFRRISCMRARVVDFSRPPAVHVRGKGHDYTVAMHPRTLEVLGRHLPWRQDYLHRWTPSARVLVEGDWLFPAFSRRAGFRLGPYGETGFDALMERVSAQAGIRFSNHDLRRTFGRELWEAVGRDTETVSLALGHRSETETRKYLGLGTLDLQVAMEKLAERQRLVRGSP